MIMNPNIGIAMGRVALAFCGYAAAMARFPPESEVMAAGATDRRDEPERTRRGILPPTAIRPA